MIKYEKVPTRCPECGSGIVLTANNVVYGRTYGKEKVYWCGNCQSYAFSVYDESTDTYVAAEIMKNKHRRRFEKDVEKLFEKKCKDYCFLPEEMDEVRKICMKYIADRIGTDSDKTRICTMTKAEIIKAKDILSHCWEKEMENDIKGIHVKYLKKQSMEEKEKKEKLAKIRRESLRKLSENEYKEIKMEASKILKTKANDRKRELRKEAAG